MAGFHPKEAFDLGICATRDASYKGKWFLRGVLKSFCAHRRPVNVHEDATKAIFDQLKYKFDKMETPFNTEPLDSHYHKVSETHVLLEAL